MEGEKTVHCDNCRKDIEESKVIIKSYFENFRKQFGNYYTVKYFEDKIIDLNDAQLSLYFLTIGGAQKSLISALRAFRNT